ncbi:MAG: hypothetical protein PGN33_22055 [Methylobacterium radiotolerans]
MCKSSVVRLYNAGDRRAACNAFLLYDKGGKPLRVIPGLVNRRKGRARTLPEGDLTMEWVQSILTTPGGVAGVGLAVGAVAAVFYAPKLAVPAALLAVLAGGLGYVERLRDDLADAQQQVEVLTDRAERAEANAKALATTANDTPPRPSGPRPTPCAPQRAYRADAVAARSDRDQIDLARQAAEIAARATACPEIHGALKDAPRRTGEDDELAPSMKAAMEALRPQAKGRHR